MILFLNFSLLAMEDSSFDKTLKDEEIKVNADEILKEINVEEILSEAKKINPNEILKQIQEEENQSKSLWLKWQNTILFGKSNWPVAFYKSDLIAVTGLILQCYFAKVLFGKILNKRIDQIFQKLISGDEGFEKLITEIQESDKTNKANEKKKLTDLGNYIKKMHQIIGYNPLKGYLLPNILIHLVGSNLISKCENALVTNGINAGFWNWFKRETWQAYERDENGDLKESKKTPFSIVQLLKFTFFPYLFFKKTYKQDFKSVGVLNNFLKMGFPKILFTDKSYYLMQILGFGLAIRSFDSYCNNLWSDYVINNNKKLYKLLKKYHQADESDKSLIETKIKSFIIQGHKEKTLIPGSHTRTWFNLYIKSRQFFQNFVTLPFIGLLYMKIGKFYWDILKFATGK